MATPRKGASSDGAPEESGVTVGDLSYSDAGAELDAIIEEFETGVIDVDRLVGQLQRATDIVDELDRRLRRTRIQVEELVPRLEAIGREEGGSIEVDEIEVDEMEDEGPEPYGEAPSRLADDAPPGLF